MKIAIVWGKSEGKTLLSAFDWALFEAGIHNFNLIPLLDLNRIANKSNQKLQFQQKHVRTMIDAKKGQIVKRKIYVFEKAN